jgi:CheY-like chemotaxis protein
VLRQIDPEHPAHAGAEAILKAGERAAGLTRQLLLFSRGQPAKPRIVDLNQVVANFETMLRRLIGEDIDLVVSLSAQPLQVLADVGQIEQVIMNLATNARDAMPLGGHLTLSTGVKRLCPNGSEAGAGAPSLPHAELAVVDTGIGMDQETLAHLFEPFFTTKNIHHGTGLGLSVSYGIVRSHKGHLKVESRPGQGSAFRVLLPLTDAAPEEAPPPSPEPPSPVVATILLVEDNHEVRRLMRDILAASGYVVLEAQGVEEAMTLGASHPGHIDLLVTDIVMPGFSGVELGKRMAALRPGLGTLYVSGYSDEEVATRALENGGVSYLQKPFTPNELARRVAESIARRI